MAIRGDFPELETPAATAFEFPPNDGETSSPLSARLPRRLRRRLSAETKATSTAEEIDAKLKEANLRREAKARKQGDIKLRRSTNRPDKMLEEGELLSRKLARCWMHFSRLRKTTYALVKEYEALEINDSYVKAISFDDLAMHIESGTTLQIVKALLERLEKRLIISEFSRKSVPEVENIDHLLKHVISQNRKSDAAKRRTPKKCTESGTETLKTLRLHPRYPARVMLCAYIIISHPEAVFYGKVGSEATLAKSAADCVREFELLVRVIQEGPLQKSLDNSGSGGATGRCFSSQLKAFDRAWCSYLYDFVVWKIEDSKLLEKELINAACELEISVMQSSKLNPKLKNVSGYRMEAEQDQGNEGLKLIRARLGQISGTAGIDNLERALEDVRSKFLEAEEIGASSIRPLTSQDSASAISDKDRNANDGQMSTQTAPSSSYGSPSPSKLTSSNSGHRGLNFRSHENEAVVNEIVHGQYGVADNFVNDDHQDGLKNKVKETMERAFWDALMESMEQDQPDFSWVLKLIKEVKDQLYELSPQKWRKDIEEAIDVDSLSEEVKSGVLDVLNLREILEFALVTLRKLSSPANDVEMQKAHSNLLKEIGDISESVESNGALAISIVKGLQFVLQQIQVLKREISKARIKLIEPLIKGPTGMEYLTRAFHEHYGPPADASRALPLTANWISSTHPSAEPEWEEHLCSQGNLVVNDRMDPMGLPPITLRTGGAVSAATSMVPPVVIPSGKEQLECRGDKVDMVVRLGLLKLVSEVEGLKQDGLPETLKLNFSRLRAVQSQMQKIIVISTSSLVLRQTLLSENSLRAAVDVEQVISDCIKHLTDLLDRFNGAGMEEIVGTIGSLLEHQLEPEKLQSVSTVMANLLVKSLQAGNPIFTKVSRAVYVAARGIVLGGSGQRGRQLAESVLRRIGASSLVDRLVGMMEVLITVAVVSHVVHGQWYEALLGSL
ncbi:hypothetical protein SAY87_014253 [Trapa incisa]|uniref:T-complex protein 11 n=1 Tax=Trapa incisa TaxID=236973 RepID=A0AAN7JKD2_9MYRT|nr:hypothetical protein SAY87_014253 [Trapa incisa]